MKKVLCKAAFLSLLIPFTLFSNNNPVFASGLQCSGSGLSAKCTLVIATDLSLEVSQDQVTDLGGLPAHPSYKFTGAVEMITPLKPFWLFNAEIVVEWLDDLGRYEIWGRADLPDFDVPVLDAANITGNKMVMLGVVSRDTLIDLFGPDATGLNPGGTECSEEPGQSLLPVPDISGHEGYYMFFHSESSLNLEVGLSSLVGIPVPSGTKDPLTFSYDGVDESFTLIIDPTNPYIYMTIGGVTAALDDKAKASLKKKPTTKKKYASKITSRLKLIKTVAFSLKGGLHFAPQTIWGLTGIDKVGEFDGQLYVEGTIPIYKVFEIDGNIMWNIDIGGSHGGVESGFNGILNFAPPWAGFFPNIPLLNGVELGNASGGNKAGITVSDGTPEPSLRMYVSGMKCPSEDFPLGKATFLFPKTSQTMNLAMYLDVNNIDDSLVHMQGEFTVVPGSLLSSAGSLGNLPATSGELIIDKNGLVLTASTSANLLPSLINIDGSSSLVVSIPFDYNIANAYIELQSKLTIYGVGLEDATQRIGASGIILSGTANFSGGNNVTLSGTIDVANVSASLSGEVNINIPIPYNAKEYVNYVKDAAVCGSSYVVDAAKCGSTYAQDAAKCGSSYVVDAAKCGASYVTDAASCGWSYVSSVSLCGWTCGNYYYGACTYWYPSVCYTPASCSVANGCNWANSCSFANGCNWANDCDKLKETPKVSYLTATLEFDLNSPSGLKGELVGGVLAGIGAVAGAIDVVGDNIDICIDIPMPDSPAGLPDIPDVHVCTPW